jgi:DNA-binding MarR family transcriptional regulator
MTTTGPESSSSSTVVVAPGQEPDSDTATEDRAAIDALEEVSRAFKGMMGAFRRLRGRETHRPGELSYAQHSLLFGLSGGGALSARELAAAADLSPATVTEMLDGLAAAGLVQRVRSEHDKRVVLTSLTERGNQLIEERRSRWEPRWRAAVAEFTDQDLLTAAAVLDRLREFLDEVSSEE